MEKQVEHDIETRDLEGYIGLLKRITKGLRRRERCLLIGIPSSIHD